MRLLILLYLFIIPIYSDNILQKGLILDLDANQGVVIDSKGHVNKWYNQIDNPKVRYFEDMQKERKELLLTPQNYKPYKKPFRDGLPELRKSISDINGHDSIYFNGDELHHSKEEEENWDKAFGKLHNESGFTWFVVINSHEPFNNGGAPNAFFGNLRNTAPPQLEKYQYAGFYGGFHEMSKTQVEIWGSTRAGYEFMNPKVKKVISTNQWYIISVRQGSFKDLPFKGEAKEEKSANEIWVNGLLQKDATKYVQRGQSDVLGNRMVIGQERDARNHMGWEAFVGEMARFLIYDRPLGNNEMELVHKKLTKKYFSK